MSEALKVKFVESNSFNPWLNLAYEEYLLNNIMSNEVILYLWQNERTVVIGANQNPWKECNTSLLESDGGKLARRLSGGGAVYHDLGNLNFTFIMDKSIYDFSKQVMVIINALKEQGISAEFTGRNDILVNDKKISGNAFYFRENKALHHGTVLVNCDFAELTKYLQVSKEKIKSKGIESIKSRVNNLKDIDPNIDIEEIKESLKRQFVISYGDYEQLSIEELNNKEIEKLYDKYSSWDWRYGDTPKFAISMVKRFDWGELDINLNLEKGIIKEVKIYSDAMDPNITDNIKEILLGASLNEINSRFNNYETYEYEEIKEWIVSELKNL